MKNINMGALVLVFEREYIMIAVRTLEELQRQVATEWVAVGEIGIDMSYSEGA